MRLHVAAFALSALAFLAPRAGLASPTFPPAIKSFWGVSRLPEAAGREGCLLCHATEVGGVVGTPFGRTAKARGAAGTDNLTLLKRALDVIRSSGVDSDGDEIGDYQEIARDRTDPNDPDDFVVPEPPNEGGAGGETGSAGIGASGGHAPVDPPEEPPKFGEFPPLPAHGCGVAGGDAAGVGHIALLVIAFACVRAARRSRRRIDTKAQRHRAQNVSCNDFRASVHSRGRSAHGHR
jgi:hypothetical protein